MPEDAGEFQANSVNFVTEYGLSTSLTHTNPLHLTLMKCFRPIVALALAILVLVSSTSFMVGLHLCMGEVQSITLFGKANGCEKEQNLPPCHHEKAPCCQDDTVVHQRADFQASFAHFQYSAPLLYVVDQPLIPISEIIPTALVAKQGYTHYDPPLRSCDHCLEYRVFLI